MQQVNYDVVIIGAGVSGLASACELHRRGYKVAVLERQVLVGGSAQTRRRGGFLIECGPSTIAGNSLAAINFSQSLKLDGQRCDLGEGVRKRYLVKNGKLQGIPLHSMAFLSSDYLSVAGRLRLLAEPFVPRGRAANGIEESVDDFCRRRFGREFSERVMKPLASGIYAGRSEDLSVSAVFPRLATMERDHGSIAGAVLHRRKSGLRMPGRRLFSWRNGVGSLPGALSAELGGAVHTGTTVRSIKKYREGFIVDAGNAGRLTSKSIVLATQPHVAAGLLDNVDADAASAARELAAPPMAVVFLGFRRGDVEHSLDGLGYLSAPAEGRLSNGAQFASTMFAGRAPAGHVAVSFYFGGAVNPEMGRLPTDELVDIACSEAADLIGARRSPVISNVQHWSLGLPQYCLGHGRRIEKIRRAEANNPGIFITGNYFRGPSVAECLTLALDTSCNVSDYLDRRCREHPISTTDHIIFSRRSG